MPTKKKQPAQTPSQPSAIQPEDVKNALTAPVVYCNNFQMQGGMSDVWLFFNEIIPNGRTMSVERKVSVVMSTNQFLAVLQMLNQQALHLQKFVETLESKQEAQAAAVTRR